MEAHCPASSRRRSLHPVQFLVNLHVVAHACYQSHDRGEGNNLPDIFFPEQVNGLVYGPIKLTRLIAARATKSAAAKEIYSSLPQNVSLRIQSMLAFGLTIPAKSSHISPRPSIFVKSFGNPGGWAATSGPRFGGWPNASIAWN